MRAARLRRRSPAKAAWYESHRDVVMELTARSNGWCEIPGCPRRADHPHHVWPTGNGGPDTIANLLHVCWLHHRQIHDEPWWSRPLGYLR